MADWLGPEGVWNVESLDGRGSADAFTQAINHAQACNVADGVTPNERIRVFAEYLGLDPDWDQLVERCHELGS